MARAVVARGNVIPRIGSDTNPLSLIGWRQAFWAGDSRHGLTDGGAVSSWRASGTSWGAYLNTGAGLNLPGVAGNYASTPDTAALSITGDVTLVCRAALADWTPAVNSALVGKYNGATNQKSYLLNVSTAGGLAFTSSVDGIASTVSVTSSSTVSFADGQTGWVAVSFDVDDGAGNNVVKFWTSTDGLTWAQLGTTRTNVGATSIFDGTAPVEVGSFSLGTSYLPTGSISVARIYSGSGFSAAGPSGTLVFDADFRRADTPTFTADTGQTVTVNSTFYANQTTAGSKPTFRAATTAFNNQPTVQFDGGDYLASGAGTAQAQPVSVVVIGQMTTLGGAGAVQLFCDSISAARMAVGTLQTGSKVEIIGTSALDFDGADTGVHMYRALFNTTASTITEDGVSLGTGTTGVTVSPTGMTIGASYLAANQMTGHIAFVGWFVGDVTGEANWPTFKQWAATTYGLTIS